MKDGIVLEVSCNGIVNKEIKVELLKCIKGSMSKEDFEIVDYAFALGYCNIGEVEDVLKEVSKDFGKIEIVIEVDNVRGKIYFGGHVRGKIYFDGHGRSQYVEEVVSYPEPYEDNWEWF